MHWLLIWCVDQIKKLRASIDGVAADLSAIKSIIDIIQPGGQGSFLSGHGDPEGVKIGLIAGQTYLDVDSGRFYIFNGTPGTNTGWT